MSDLGTELPIASAILAGGRASRMGGRQKARLTIEGRTILERQLAVLPGEVFVVGADLGLPRVDDPIAGAGPLAGILAAVLHRPRVLVVACDMPWLDPALIARLRATEGDAVVPLCLGEVQPLCALYTRAIADPLRRFLAGGERSVRVFLDRVPVVHVEHDDPRAFTNCNSPADLR